MKTIFRKLKGTNVLILMVIVAVVLAILIPIMTSKHEDHKNATLMDEYDRAYSGVLSNMNNKSEWYKIVTDSTESYYYFTLRNETEAKGIYATVYNEKNEELAVCVAEERDNTWNIRLEPNSNYYVKVYYDHFGFGSYTYTLQVAAKSDEVGDTEDSATEIQINNVISSSIDGHGDVDCFALKTEAINGEYQLIYNNETGTTNGHVSVRSDQNEELIRVGNYTGAGQSTTETFTLKANSTYYFRVYLNDDGVGSYSFKLLRIKEYPTLDCAEGHTPSGVWSTITEPTCIADGEKVQRCSVCGTVIETKTINALGHNYSDKKIVTEATIIAYGKKEAVCPRCGEVEYFTDWSKVWILPTIIIVGILLLIGIINYAKAFSKSKKGSC